MCSKISKFKILKKCKNTHPKSLEQTEELGVELGRVGLPQLLEVRVQNDARLPIHKVGPKRDHTAHRVSETQ